VVRQSSWLRRGSARGFGTWTAPACALALLAFGMAAPTAAGASKLAPDPSPGTAETGAVASASEMHPDSFGPQPAAVVAPAKARASSIEHLPSVVTATVKTATASRLEPARPETTRSKPEVPLKTTHAETAPSSTPAPRATSPSTAPPSTATSDTPSPGSGITLPVTRVPVVTTTPPVTPALSQPAAPKPRRSRHVAVQAPLDLSAFRGRLVSTAVLAPVADFAAADVLRPSFTVAAPPSDGRRVVVPAALALLALVIASGSFLGLAFRLRQRGTSVLR
jgi:hypothetical protein